LIQGLPLTFETFPAKIGIKEKIIGMPYPTNKNQKLVLLI